VFQYVYKDENCDYAIKVNLTIDLTKTLCQFQDIFVAQIHGSVAADTTMGTLESAKKVSPHRPAAATSDFKRCFQSDLP